MSDIKFNSEFFVGHLSSRVSQHNAKIIFESAVQSMGLNQIPEEFKKDEAQNLCLALIKKGGPAFQIGTQIYKQYLQ